MKRLKFVSYDGDYPNLCRGNLILELDGQLVKFPPYCLTSGGNVWFDGDWEEHVEQGEWEISSFPVDFPEDLKNEATKLVNENVRQGCCGGCV